MLLKDKKIALVGCSNPLPIEQKENVTKLIQTLKKINITAQLGDFIFEDDCNFDMFTLGQKRAKKLNEFYSDNTIEAIFDISGGNVANLTLPYIKINQTKPFFGYSDLTTIVNGIYAKNKNQNYLYQIMNIVNDSTGQQLNWFENTFINGKNDLFNFNYNFWQNDTLKGEVVGGNIRCLLKLAGSDFFPDVKNKILFLESLSGNKYLILSLLNQLKIMGVLNSINGLILGSFTQLEKETQQNDLKNEILKLINFKNLPVVKTNEIGHQTLSKGIIIGKEITL